MLDTVLSITVLAAILLLVGAFFLWRRTGNVKNALLMVLLAQSDLHMLFGALFLWLLLALGATDATVMRLPDPLTAAASGWMRVRQRAKQRGVEMPLVISDHADWDELMQTLEDVGAPEVWVTHGREEALVHAARQRGIEARALSLVGFEEEGQ